MQINSNPRMRDVIFYYAIKGIVTTFVFSVRVVVYFLDLTLLLLSNLLEKLVLENWDYWYNKYVDEDEDEEASYKIEIIESDDSSKHEYVMHRSKQYKKAYDEFESLIKITNNVSLTLDEALYKDIMLKLNKLINIVDKESLKNGYKFAKETNGEIEQEDIYKKFIATEVFKGE